MQREVTIGLITLDSYVGLYAETLRYLASNFKRRGYRIIRVGCEGDLKTCTSINSIGNIKISPDLSLKVCEICKRSQSKIFSDKVINLSKEADKVDNVSEVFIEKIESILKKEQIIASVIEETFQSLSLCKIAFFDFSIFYKKSLYSPLAKEEIARFISGIRDLLVLNINIRNLLLKNNLTHVVYINGNYSQNTLIRQLCLEKNIVCNSVETQFTSQDFKNKVFLKIDRLELAPEAISPINNNKNLSNRHVVKVLNSFKGRIKGLDFNAYTSLNVEFSDREAVEIRFFFKKFQRIHTYFMSSEDEFVPHRETHDFDGSSYGAMYFTGQLEFTKFYLAQAALNPDIGFIVRLHPRMAKNKRDAFESEEHLMYKKLLSELPPSKNILIIYGDSKISSYFLANRSDLVVVSWSTIGLEVLLLGTPVVSVFLGHLMYPLDKFSLQPKTEEELNRALFHPSEFGVVDDLQLLKWLSVAYEGQFIPTIAPRDKGNFVGKLYRRLYRMVDMFGLYEVYANMADRIFMRGVSTSNNLLLSRNQKSQKVDDEKWKYLLNSYRQSVKKSLDKYEIRLFR